MRTSLIPLSVLVLAFVPSVAFGQNAPDPLAAAWQDLLSADEAKATRAALALAAKPQEAVAFLKAKLHPVKADAKTVSKLIENLNNKDFQTREAAHADLEYLGKYIGKELQAAVAATSDEETKTRLGKLIARIELEDKANNLKEEQPAPNQPGGRGANVAIRTVNGVTTVFINGKPIDTSTKVITKPGPLPTWVRAGRAIGILEHIGTPEARQLLEVISLGEDTATPTAQAQDALARIKRQK